ncbi:MAG: hypothetical protein ACYC2K_17290 [Gemmatimonadales bacterium]
MSPIRVWCALGTLILLLTAPGAAQTRKTFAVAPLGGLTLSSADIDQSFVGGQIEYQVRSRRITLDGKALFKRDGRSCIVGECTHPSGNGFRVGIGFDQRVVNVAKQAAPYVGAHLGLQSQEGESATVGIRAGVDFVSDAPITLRTEVGFTRILGADYHEAHVGLAVVISL